MIENLNALTQTLGILLTMSATSCPFQENEGGSVTERHILYALSLKLIGAWGRGERLLSALESLGLAPDAKNRAYLSDTQNPHYAYDLLGALKGGLTEKFYVNAGEEECPDVRELTALGREAGAIPAYAYLGDVTESVTGDKRRRNSRTTILTGCSPFLKEVGFAAVTYMPSRNTPRTLRCCRLCAKHGFLR